MTGPAIRSATRALDPKLATVLAGLRPGQQIRITQQVRVGRKVWTTTVEGTFRHLGYLATGLSAQRVPEDDIVVATIHFTKDNCELSSIALDEQSRVEVIAK
jgi:hypothetical protein